MCFLSPCLKEIPSLVLWCLRITALQLLLENFQLESSPKTLLLLSAGKEHVFHELCCE